MLWHYVLKIHHTDKRKAHHYTYSKPIQYNTHYYLTKDHVGRGLKLVASKVGRIHLGKTNFSGSTRRKPKTRVRQGSTRGIHKPDRALTPKPKKPHVSYVHVRIELN
jgi:hypothetical protein